MTAVEKADEMLEEYRELCEYFDEKQKPMNDFSQHYQELKERLHDEAMKKAENSEEHF